MELHTERVSDKKTAELFCFQLGFPGARCSKSRFSLHQELFQSKHFLLFSLLSPIYFFLCQTSCCCCIMMCFGQMATSAVPLCFVTELSPLCGIFTYQPVG
ncbi:hypothetical protein AMECASPLE_006550 [Ameca splendens]|uniref:Uncharacterized protein n=1 Tax=Ameca splendens TaxID=208324 RepID=A0ABV0XNF1_9TELE